MSKDVALSLFVTVFAQKIPMLVSCTDVVLQKWVTEDIVVHNVFLEASLCILSLLDICECVWKASFIQLGNPVTVSILTAVFSLIVLILMFL